MRRDGNGIAEFSGAYVNFRFPRRGRIGCAFSPAKCLDGLPQAKSEIVGVANRHPRCFNRLSGNEGQLAGIQMPGVHGEQIEDSRKRNGDKRNLRPDGKIGGTGQEGLQHSIERPSSFFRTA